MWVDSLSHLQCWKPPLWRSPHHFIKLISWAEEGVESEIFLAVSNEMRWAPAKGWENDADNHYFVSFGNQLQCLSSLLKKLHHAWWAIMIIIFYSLLNYYDNQLSNIALLIEKSIFWTRLSYEMANKGLVYKLWSALFFMTALNRTIINAHRYTWDFVIAHGGIFQKDASIYLNAMYLIGIRPRVSRCTFGM